MIRDFDWDFNIFGLSKTNFEDSAWEGRHERCLI
jgi:hypothetical protein